MRGRSFVDQNARHDAGLILSCRPSGLLDRHIRSFHALRPVGEALPPLADLRPASIGLPKNGDDGRVGEARRITFAVINVTDNVRGELSAHVITVSELNRQKIARAIECDGHDAESVGIIDTTGVVRRDHSLYLTVAKDISSSQARTKRAISSNAQHDQFDKSDTD
jgi:hypothetical protein